MDLMEELIKPYGYVRAWMDGRAYRPNAAAVNKWVSYWALGLFFADIVFMIRGYAVSNLVETLLFATFVFSSGLRNEFLRCLRDPVVFVLMVFFGWALFSGLWSTASLSAIVEDWWGWRKLLLLPIGLVLLSTERRATGALYTLAGMGLVYIAVAMLDYTGIGQFWQREYYQVVQDHNVQGLYFSVIGLACLLYGWANRDRRIMALALIALAAVYFAFVAWLGTSRSGYVSFAIALSLAGAYLLRTHLAGLVLGIIVAGSVLWHSPVANQRVDQAMAELSVGALAAGGSATSGSIRFVMWENTLKLIEKSPLIGSGAGDFGKAYAAVVEGQAGWRATLTDDPHNQYLHIWGEYGLVGLLLFLAFLGAIFFRIHWRRVEGVLLASTLLTSATVSIFNGVYGGAAMGRFVLVSLTIYLALSWFRQASVDASAEN